MVIVIIALGGFIVLIWGVQGTLKKGFLTTDESETNAESSWAKIGAGIFLLLLSLILGTYIISSK